MSKRKLLLADDSVTIQKVVNLTFADEGIEVVAVGDGNSAIDSFRENVPDIVLADVNMPGLNGYEFCEKIRQTGEGANVPVVLLVGSFEPFDEQEALRIGANGHLTKPFQSINQLVETVTNLIAGKKEKEASVHDPDLHQYETAPLDSNYENEVRENKAGISGAMPPVPIPLSTPESRGEQRSSDANPKGFEYQPVDAMTGDSSSEGLPEVSGQIQEEESYSMAGGARESSASSAEYSRVGYDDEMIETNRLGEPVIPESDSEAESAQSKETTEEDESIADYQVVSEGEEDADHLVGGHTETDQYDVEGSEHTSEYEQVRETEHSAVSEPEIETAEDVSSPYEPAITEKFSSTYGSEPAESENISAEFEQTTTQELPIDPASIYEDTDGKIKLDETNLLEVPIPDSIGSKVVEDDELALAVDDELVDTDAESHETVEEAEEAMYESELAENEIDSPAVESVDTEEYANVSEEFAVSESIETNEYSVDGETVDESVADEYAVTDDEVGENSHVQGANADAVQPTSSDKVASMMPQTTGVIGLPSSGANVEKIDGVKEEELEPATSDSSLPAETQAIEDKNVRGSNSSRGEIRLSNEDLDEIARRVAERISDRAIRDVAWEVVPPMSERIIKELAEENIDD